MPALKKSPEPESPKTTVLAVELGVGGTTALTEVVTNPDLSPKQKKETLKILFGLTEEEANAIASP